jgi:ABC-2 type transport system permease protein
MGRTPVDSRLNFISFLTISRKETSRVLRIWVQTLLPPLITTTLYFIIFGRFVGSQISDVHGYSYMEFIVPGLIMMSIINNAYINVSSSFFGLKFGRSIEELLISPTSSVTIILGFVTGGVVRAILVGTLVTVVGLFFTHLHIKSFSMVLVFALLTSILFALAGLTNAIIARKFDDVSIIPNFVLTPLTYLSGVFYSISLLPEFWQKVSRVNPILYMVNGFRYGFLGVTDVNFGIAIAIIIVFISLLFSLNLFLLNRGIGLKT